MLWRYLARFRNANTSRFAPRRAHLLSLLRVSSRATDPCLCLISLLLSLCSSATQRSSFRHRTGAREFLLFFVIEQASLLARFRVPSVLRHLSFVRLGVPWLCRARPMFR